MSTPATTTNAGASEAIRHALVATDRPAPASRLQAALAFGWRGMLKVKHVPEQLLDVTITPVMFLLMFTYLFGGAIEGSTSEYLSSSFRACWCSGDVYDGLLRHRDQHRLDEGRRRPLPLAADLAPGAAPGGAARRLRSLPGRVGR